MNRSNSPLPGFLRPAGLDMRNELVTDLLHHLDQGGSLHIGECGEGPAEYLSGLSLPSQVFSILRWTWPTMSGTVGRYMLFPVAHIVELLKDYPSLAPSAMLPVGEALNGDLLVFRYTADGSVEVGLVNHDDFWEKCKDTPTQAYVCVTPTLEEYLLRAAEGLYLPIDYYAARELHALHTEMGRTRAYPLPDLEGQ